MALKFFVKVDTNNLSDARYCAGMEVNLIGFNLESANSDYISPEQYKEITSWLSGVSYVGEFKNYTNEEILHTLESYSIDYLQVEDYHQLDFAKTLNIPVILKVSLQTALNLPDDIVPDYLMILSDNDEWSPEQVQKIKNLSPYHEILLSTGITADNVEFLIKETGAVGVALQGSDELRPGYKDYDELADILEALEVQD